MYMYRNKYAVKHLIYDDFNHFVPPPLLKKENRKKHLFRLCSTGLRLH